MIPVSQFYEDVSIVKMVVEDISEVQLIEKEENLAPWSFEGYSSEIENLDSFCLIAKFRNEIIGFAITRLITSDKVLEIYNIAIKKKYQRKKIATKIFDEIFKECNLRDLQEIWLDVRESNMNAIKFYNQLGFKAELTRKLFYSNPPEDGIIMKNILN